ncbi:MAG: right-handed parallel beta-helix repeat-containing protein [Acidobacteriia bacterium]|nr:right-handed parallel beta-helix repeat-containing protein [Terriglobia bacterium]
MRSDSVYCGNRTGSSPLRRVAVLLAAAFWLLLSSGLAQGADIKVDCSNAKAKVNTITGALAQLSKTAENTIHVSGTCNESVWIEHFESLNLLANPGASINDPTPSLQDENDVIDIYDSGSVTVDGFTINGGVYGVACIRTRFCYVRNTTVQGASESGVIATGSSNLYLEADTIQDNTWAGVEASRAPILRIMGGTIQHNDTGVSISAGSTLTLSKSMSGDALTIKDNTSAGVAADTNSTVTLWAGTTTISSNGEVGISLKAGSVADIRGGNTIAGGATGAVFVGDLSLARFGPGNTVTGGPPAVNCTGKYPVAIGLENLPGIETNCP